MKLMLSVKRFQLLKPGKNGEGVNNLLATSVTEEKAQNKLRTTSTYAGGLLASPIAVLSARETNGKKWGPQISQPFIT